MVMVEVGLASGQGGGVGGGGVSRDERVRVEEGDGGREEK